MFGAIKNLATSLKNTIKAGPVTLAKNIATKIFPQDPIVIKPSVTPKPQPPVGNAGHVWNADTKQWQVDNTTQPQVTTVPQVQQQVQQHRTTPRVKNYEEFKRIAMPIFQEYQIPASVGFSMKAAETGRAFDNSNLGEQRNNFYNIAAYDSNPQNATAYNSPEEGVRAFAELIKNHPRYKKAYQSRYDAKKMLQEIENAGYAGDQRTYYKRANNGYSRYSQFVMDTPEFRDYYGQ